MNNEQRLPDFDTLVEQYYERLFGFAMRLSGCYDDALDLTQQTFLIAFTKQQQLKDASKVRPWLYQILLREYLQGRRRRLRFPHHEMDQVAPLLPTVTENPGNRIDGRQLLEALQKMDDHHRIPLVLFYVADMPYAEIAQVLDLPMGTVMSRLHRGKAMLRAGIDRKAPVPAPGARKSHWKQSIVDAVDRLLEAQLSPQPA